MAMKTAKMPATATMALVVAGAGLQWLGVADNLLVHVTGKDLGINGTFWFRFLCNSGGLAAMTVALVLYLPRKLRSAGSLVLGAGSLYLLMLPGYYQIFDGPLAEYEVMPWEIILKPYQAPQEQRRAPVGHPGPELALKAENMRIWALRAGKSDMDSLESASLGWKTKTHG